MEGRFIAPWHNVYWYADSDSFQQGITAIEDAYHQKGIEDYVIVKFHFPDPSMSYTQYSALKSEDVDGLDVKKLRENEYIAYTAVQMLSKDKCLKILSQDKSMLAEAQELLPDMEEEEALCYLHESVETVAPFPKSDHYEIGYPAKFSYFFEHEDSMPLGIIRHGIFLRNTVLSDDTLYSELRGEDGSTGQIFKKHVRMSSLAHVKNSKKI